MGKDIIKYSPEDIERIFKACVSRRVYHEAKVKNGVICEYAFTYPNGKTTAGVVSAFSIDPANNDREKGCAVCDKKIKDELWNICGQYTLITGEKL